ncbi:tail fiber domain-containing protein [Pseudomonas sp. NBRC 111139]|uniref:tail fiber domain-containing protein n=1 Tax=Pseudomonas sp. NBRC 111139 TaxID=1661054 RepID=UPI0008636EF0|nr:tail fiber domain-containing protein [Pseudomonas sp. NBRC 111139]
MELKSIYAQDQRGNVLPGASAALYLAGTLTLASGLLRKDGSSHPNPFAADSTGLIELIAPDGAYDLVVNNSASSLTQRLVFFSAEDAVITPLQFGAKGDGASNDSAKFTDLGAVYQGKTVDLAGRTYLVNAFPTDNFYINGKFKRVSDGLTVQSEYNGTFRIGNSNTLAGRQVAQNLTPYSIYGAGPRGYNLTAYGDKALASAGDETYNCSAFGPGAMFNNRYARYNEVFGLEALYYTVGISGDGLTGTRNSVFGSNAMRFNTTGRSNTAMGRNANQVATTANFNTFLGAASGAGAAPLDLSGAIVNPYPRTANNQTGVGTNSLLSSNGEGNTGIGNNAGQNLKLGSQNTALGSGALSTLESNVSPNGNQLIQSSLAGTWSQVGTVLTFNMTAHGMSVGFTATVVLNTGAPNTGGDPQHFTLTAATADSWTAVAPDSAARAGTCTLTAYETTTPVAPITGVTAAGYGAMLSATGGNNCTAYGSFALRDNIGASNTAVGGLAGLENTTGTQNTAIGYSALRLSKTGGQNTAGGEFALGALTSGSGNTAFGRSALRGMQDGSAAATLNNATGIGQGASVSGDNQVQLGNSATTTYVYGTVQNRSDARDKTEIRDTVLGLDFINALRPVDFKWDMREDYNETKEVEVVQADGTIAVELQVTIHERDGTKARNRFHHGFIAQEVAEVIKNTGVDFGGLQDHAVLGGCDVMSIGYDEVIAPLVKSVQQLTAQIQDLRAEVLELRASSEGGLQP